MKKKRIRRIIAVFILLPIAAVIGGSFYMLAFSLRPDAKMREKNATAYEYMYAEYPFLRPWVDSLQTAGALRDTVIADPRGVRLHALYAAAPVPTDRTAVIVHGYTDCAVRMLMIGYSITMTWGITSCCRICITTGRAKGGQSAWGGSTASICCTGWRLPTGFSAAIREWSCMVSRWGLPRR